MKCYLILALLPLLTLCGADVRAVDWSITLSGSSGGKIDEATFGVEAEAADGCDSHDIPEAPCPPGGTCFRLYFPQDCGLFTKYNQLTKAPYSCNSDEKVWNLQIGSTTDSSVHLSWTVDDSVPLECDVMLIDTESNDTLYMRSNTSYTYDSDVLRDFAIHIADFKPDDVSETPETDVPFPDGFFLSDNYPNPFNSQTIIKYDLPKASNVQITIYNILGQRVNNLVNGERPAGFHQVTWDGDNVQGKTVASGVYFYRIKAEGFTKSKKMVLLK